MKGILEYIVTAFHRASLQDVELIARDLSGNLPNMVQPGDFTILATRLEARNIADKSIM